MLVQVFVAVSIVVRACTHIHLCTYVRACLYVRVRLYIKYIRKISMNPESPDGLSKPNNIDEAGEL